VFILKPLARSLVLPPALCLVLILIGALLIWRRRRFGWPLFIAGFASLWLFCTPLVADRLTMLVERYPALNPDQPVNAQAVVVLGGGEVRLHAPEYNGAIVEGVPLLRVNLAAFLAKRYKLPLAVSGAPWEAAAMSQTLSRDFGVTPRWIEGNSRDTYENAQLSAKILFPQGIRRIVLVTSGPHEWRAAHEFMDAGFEVVPAPSGVIGSREMDVFGLVPSPRALLRSNAAVYEMLGEPMRQLLAILHVRERFDSNVRPASTPAIATSPK
jgi:uncharacterized SAM-binding protein YcdF (DUF218 family)